MCIVLILLLSGSFKVMGIFRLQLSSDGVGSKLLIPGAQQFPKGCDSKGVWGKNLHGKICQNYEFTGMCKGLV